MLEDLLFWIKGVRRNKNAGFVCIQDRVAQPKFGKYLKCQTAYAIMPVGKNDESAHSAREKPRCSCTGAFLFRCGGVAYAPG